MKIPYGLFGLILTFTIGAHAAPELRLIDRGDGHAVWMSRAEMEKISREVHEAGRCGGFLDVTDHQSADTKRLPGTEWFLLQLKDRMPTQQVYLQGALPQLDSQRLFKTVTELSAFRNRYYQSDLGVKAAQYVADQFKALSKGRTDVTVETVKHRWAQNSVIATIQGSGAHANEIVVIGGHEDSINQGAFGSSNMLAPGADDNATGIATTLEVFRVLIETGFKTDRTLKFMAYAGEEEGLLGSQDIATQFKKTNQAVVGVIQFDMTAFPGSGDKIVFITDHTNHDLTAFTEKLVDTYVKTPWITDECGYACSDHASWTRSGYASVMPAEATMQDDNKDIHTTRDVIGKLDFNHAIHYAQLGLSFLAELSHDQ